MTFNKDFNIITIDNENFYWNFHNECLIPYELIKTKDNEISLNYINNDGKKNTNENTNKNKKADEDKDIIINLEWYMEIYDIDFWENILSRKLYNDEKKLIFQIWNENSFNQDIKKLQQNIIKHNCYIKNITLNIGNCLFESIGSLGLGENDLDIEPSQMIRKNLATLLLAVKTEIGFFPNLPDSTPEEIFLNQNDIEFVKDHYTKLVYVYNYDMMIYDLNTNYSWKRLPTEFLLMAISRIYQVEILIYHNKSNYINKINVWDKIKNHSNYDNKDNTNNEYIDDDIKKIRLGQINEEHYFPLSEIPDKHKNNVDIINKILKTEIKYDKWIKKFNKWSKNIMDSIGLNDNLIKLNDNLIKLNDNEHNYNHNFKLTNNNFLTQEQIDDYKEISNFEKFKIL